MVKARVYRISLPTADVPSFLDACEASEWYAFDTGERVMTDEGHDAEAVLLVEPGSVVRTGAPTAIPA